MSGARGILTCLIPGLLLVGALDCFSSLNLVRPCNHFCPWLLADEHQEHGDPSDVKLFDQAAQRWSRRVNIHPGSGGFGPPAGLVLAQVAALARSGRCLTLPRINLELVQSWQFHWRTALEPRAPSLVS